MQRKCAGQSSLKFLNGTTQIQYGEPMSKYELLEKHEHLFFDAVTRLRRGSEFMDIVHALDGACTAAGFSSMTLAAEARVYLEELQREAFNAAVEAFESGES